ncbi:hypothetical protein HAX54_031021 [Datura stramonium]|uniref:ACT domain-containing protein n=1 Tax=Datura stramonium TaxID=4076 RepID=A0ABS8RLK9_DATST|nr:hypothetical protein [Datura stramonium]
MAIDDNESCVSRAMEPSSPKHSRLQRQKLQAFNQVLSRLKDLNLEEADLPGFEHQLWLHFNRLPARYALDVNVERAEDVLMHRRLLQLPEDPENRPAFDVHLVQVQSTYNGISTYSDVVNSAVKEEYPSIHPPPTFGSSANLQPFEIHDNNAHVHDGESDVNSTSGTTRSMHEITFSTIDKPKLLTQLTTIVSEIGLNIEEAHVFSTADGFSLDVFVVDGWPYEEEDYFVVASLKVRCWFFLLPTKTFTFWTISSWIVGRFSV